MKRFLVLLIVFEFSLVNTYIINFHQKTNKIDINIKNNVQNLRNLQTNDTNSDLYDTSTDETTDIETVDTSDIKDIETDIDATDTQKTSNLYLIGFDYFKIEIRIFRFNMYFKFLSGNIYRQKIVFSTNIYYYRIFRNLQNIEKKDVECNYVENANDFYKYDCYSNLDRDVNLTDIEKVEVNHDFEDTSDDTKVFFHYNYNANKTMENLLKANTGEFEGLTNKNKNIYYLTNGTISYKPELDRIYINNLGISKYNNSLIINESEKENIPGQYNFKFRNNYTNEIINTSCILTVDNNLYELECTPNGTDTLKINETFGYGFDGQNKDNIVFLNIADEMDILNLNSSSNNYQHKYYKTSSSGLSGGAIAGIVIVCVVTLVVISLFILFFRKKREEMEGNNESTSSALNVMNNISK